MKKVGGGGVSGMICRKWITTRDGKKIFAESYGKEAFCFIPSPTYLQRHRKKKILRGEE